MAAANIEDVTVNSQALTVDALGKAYAAQMSRQAIIADRKFDELDIEQSVANRYATTGKPASGE
ncbi:MAG: hypothetical protein MI757_17605 [Pirellulales bacterium]|nr:hypothetical protein [Pirellulales bacterium]